MQSRPIWLHAVGLIVALLLARPATAESESLLRFRWVPPRMSVGQTHVLAKARYSTESRLGLGAEVFRRFRLPGAMEYAPPSDVRLRGLVTLRGTGRAQLRTTLFPGRGRFGLQSRIEFDNVRSRFWGLGANTSSSAEEVFQAQSILAYLEFLSRVGKWELGVRAEVELVDYLEVESGGLLDTVDYRGIEADDVMGLGLVINRDARDRRYAPTRGTLLQILVMGFPDDLGSELSFNLHSVDARHYHSLGQGAVLASQVFSYAVRGTPPIWRYAALGGRAHSRGYRRGRYLDRVLTAAQVEIRSPTWRRLGVVGHGGLATVSPDVSRIRGSRVRPTVGGGLRLTFGSDDDVVVRIDGAFGVNSFRFYLGLGDAF